MSKGTATTKSIDRGEARIRALIAELKGSASGPHVKVGILESAGAHKNAEGIPGGLSVVGVALCNEFGTDTIPERPALRTAARDLVPVMSELGARMLAAMILGRVTLDNALDVLGLKAQSVIKRTIRDWTDPPNAPSTILAKARKEGREKIVAARGQGKAAEAAALARYNNPLEDTGQYRNSIQYEKVK